MDTSKIRIRVATLDDAKKLVNIYKPYVEKTAISFEYKVPSVAEFRERIEKTLKMYPYLVAVYSENDSSEEILGYAYTSPFHERAAYEWSATASIYLSNKYEKRGVGKMFYLALENISRAQGILTLYACVAFPTIEDEHLTNNSVHFHRHMGFSTVGVFENSGYKFNQWYHTIWFQKEIGEHIADPSPIIPFTELKAEALLQN